MQPSEEKPTRRVVLCGDCFEKNLKIKALEKRGKELETQREMAAAFGSTMFNCSFEQDKKIKELQNRLSTVEKEVEEARQNLLHGLDTDKEKDKDLALVHLVAKTLNGFYWRDKKIQALLNASEGLEKALELFTDRYDTWIKRGFTEYSDEHLVYWNPVGHYRKAKSVLADFRAVKDNMKKGAGK